MNYFHCGMNIGNWLVKILNRLIKKKIWEIHLCDFLSISTPLYPEHSPFLLKMYRIQYSTRMNILPNLKTLFF